MRKKFTEADRQRAILGGAAGLGREALEFCPPHRASPANLYRWMRVQRGSAGPKFARLVTEAPLGTRRSPGVTVQIGDARVQVEQGFDAALLRSVVTALSGRVEP